MIPDIIVNGGNITVRPIPDNNNINVRMRNVRDIRVINTGVREIADNRVWLRQQPNAIPQNVPVTTRIGTPIVNMPGCVKAHKENAKNPANRNKMLVDNDPEGNVVLCDGGMPYFQPPDYDYRDLTWRTIYGDAPVAEGIDTGDPPPPPNTPETPGAPRTPPTTKEDVPCPPPNARREGDLNQAGTEKVTGYELQRDPNNYEQFICVTLWEDISFAERYLPSVNVITTTAGIAAVATTSALLAKPLADLLLKVIKPAVKKALAKVQKLMGKKEKILSLQERKLKQKEANAAVKAARLLKGK
tara:strand:+ start:1624 stop:2526 length:903 start_codon:yes stop_codon:yes gene_type:complete